MGRYIARRALQLIPVLLGATLILFVTVYAIPGDPIRALSGDRPLPESVQAELRDRYNLDDPLLVQYGKYMGVVPQSEEEGFSGLLQGDFGEDFRGREVSDIMSERFPVTVRLALLAFGIELVIGIAAGVLAGLKRGSFLDNLVRISTTLVISVPIFVLGYVSQLVFGVELGWFPIAGLSQGWMSYLLPGIVLAAVSLAYVARLTRTSVIENVSADYVRTATAKGLRHRRVVGVHTLRNSLIPVVTFLGTDLGVLMGGAIVTETVFNIPGIGRAVFDGILQQENAVVVGIVTALTLVFVFSNLIVDVLYGWLDPRIRYE